MNWEKLKTFYQVAKLENISKAANTLKINQSSVSRQIGDLEKSFEAPLFKREKYGVSLTEQGGIVYHCVEKMMSEFNSMHKKLNLCNKKREDELTIITTHSLKDTWLVDYLPDFIKKHPHIEIHLSGDDHHREVSSSNFEIGILPEAPSKPSVIQKLLMVRELALYAHPSYLDKFGVPKNIDDLLSHRLISFGGKPTSLPYKEINWIFNLLDQKVKPSMSVNSFYALYKAAKDGLGIISLERQSSLLKNSGFARLLPELESPKIKIYLSYLKLYERDSRIASLENYLKEIIQKEHKIII